MIKQIDGNLFESKANLIIHQVNCLGAMGAGIAKQVSDKFPHVEREYRCYLKHCKKKSIKPLGTVQYVPVDSWAIIMVDTMENNRVIAYDTEYQYIVNLFGQSGVGSGMQTDLSAVRNGLKDVYEKAKEINATVALPYKLGSCRGGAKWEDVYAIIKEIFTDVDVEIWKYDLG